VCDGLAGLWNVEDFGRRRTRGKRLERDRGGCDRIVLQDRGRGRCQDGGPDDATGALGTLGAAGVRGGAALVGFLADGLEGERNAPDLGSEETGDEDESPQAIHV
jgi:hypothetical protein